MDPHEIADELGQPAAQRLLRSATLLRLAYDGSDGFPRVIPIGFLWTGDRLVVCTADTSPKVNALRARPRVAATIDLGETPTEARSVLIRGLANVQIVEGIPDEYIAASAKALSAEEVPEFERQIRSTYPRMARITIGPVWARFLDFGAGRLPSFLEKLAGGG